MAFGSSIQRIVGRCWKPETYEVMKEFLFADEKILNEMEQRFPNTCKKGIAWAFDVDAIIRVSQLVCDWCVSLLIELLGFLFFCFLFSFSFSVFYVLEGTWLVYRTARHYETRPAHDPQILVCLR